MATDVKEEVWIGNDNIIELVVVVDGAGLTDLSGVVRITLCIGEAFVDSDEVGSDVIWWDGTVIDKEVRGYGSYTGDVIRARLGRVLLEEGVFTACRLVLYTGEYPLGWVVSDNIQITVWDTCGA